MRVLRWCYGPDVAAEANLGERQRWNNETWVELWPKRERLTSLVTPALLAALALSPGERVLDIGCGGGASTLSAGEIIGSSGRAVGADISQPLVGLARRRADHARAENVSFRVLDVQTAHVGGGPFDAAMSQFGVMFFEDPVAAFTNVRSHLVRGGRLAFACWQEMSANPWFPAVALAGIVAPPLAPAPGGNPTGPFALADPDHVRDLLTEAGFAGVAVAAREITPEVPPDSVIDDAQLVLMGIAEDRMDEARTRVEEHYARFRTETGLWRLPLAYQIVTAAAWT